MQHHQIISKITLGTAALGMDYGISNTNGQPTLTQARDVFHTALDHKITCWDTARHYGNAEERIGEVLQDQPEREAIQVVTKFRISTENLHDIRLVRAEVFSSVVASLKAMRRSKVFTALFHKRPDQPMDAIRKVLPGIIGNLKEEGLIDLGGISVYHPGEVQDIIDLPEVDAIQLPINVFDHRLRADVLKALEQDNKILFARSVFLQGLFFMDPERLTGNLVVAKPFLRRLHELCQEADMDIATLCFSYVRDLPGVSSVVFGAVNPSEVAGNAALLNTRQLEQSYREKIKLLFSEVPEFLTTPGLWKP